MKKEEIIDMKVRYEFLTEGMVGDLYRAFLDAFADYAMDMSYTTETIFRNRIIKNGIDYGSSVAAMDGEKIVGYTLVGVDEWKGSLSAFDIGTGIIKEWRGKGIAGGMFESILPRLKDAGVEDFYLEVLRENEPAIRAYRKTGFEVTRNFDCFEIDLEEAMPGRREIPGLDIAESGRACVERIAGFIDWEPSWENSLASIGRIPDEVVAFEAKSGGGTVGAVVYYPALNWIMCLAVDRKHRRRGVGTALVGRLAGRMKGVKPKLRLVNVDASDAGMKAFLERTGFEFLIGQYEMRRPIV